MKNVKTGAVCRGFKFDVNSKRKFLKYFVLINFNE